MLLVSAVLGWTISGLSCPIDVLFLNFLHVRLPKYTAMYQYNVCPVES